ncbi:MAG: rod shape-determining protein MreC [Deltaproteobacteria bacterium]|nr:rod shape-determining protein MreC [Deltaproteobacteria bacterium]
MSFFKRHKNVITACILIIISLVVLSYNVKQPSAGPVRKLVMEISASLVFSINSSIGAVKNLWNRYLFLVGMEAENRRLREQNAQLLGELIKYREGYLEAKRLQDILNLKKDAPHPAIGAQVINKSDTALLKTIMINRGTAHGLKAGLPVIASKGIVGRTTEASWHASRVLLVIDENSNIDAVIQRTRTQGILQGAGITGCRLKYVLKSDDVRQGDVVITSGLGGIFPKEILLGVVTRVDKGHSDLFQKIEVHPSIDFNKLEEVLVLVGGDKK